MPALDITAHDRQHAYRQLAEQLQLLGKSATQAGDMAKKVEMAAYNKAANQAHYHQLWQTSLRKAQTAIQQQQAKQQQAQQQAQLAAQQQAQQQAQLAAQQQAQQQAQLAAQQQAQQRAQLAAQQQAQQQAQFAAQQQQQQAQFAAQQQAQQQAQYAAHQQAQRAAMLRQQQHAQAQQQAVLQQQQAQQYVAAPQQQYGSAPQQRQQVVQQGPQQQMQYVQTQAQQAQQPMQYVPQPGAQQYAQPMQPGGQPQYMQVQQGGQPQYMQMPGQPQQQYAAQQQAGGHAMPQQYMQQPRAVQHAPQAQHAPPASLQAQVAQGQVQQQYGQPAAMAVPQHMGGRLPQQGSMPPQPGMQQQPGLDNADFVAGFPPAEAGGMLPHGMAYDPQQAQQAALPAASTTASSIPAPGAGDGGAGSTAGQGARRPLNHETGPLQEFLRLHAAFNDPRSRAMNIRDSEGMLRWYADMAKRDPNQSSKVAVHFKRNNAVLALLKSQRPTEEMSIRESVRQAVKTFLVDLKSFRDQLRRSAAKAAAAQQAAAAAPSGGGGGPSASSPASAGGFLAMMDSDKLDGSVGAAKVSGCSLAQPGSSLPQPGGSLPPPAGAVKPAPGRPPAAPGSAASVAAEAARQQALLRQRQAAAAAGAEQQRRAAAAVPAGPPLPADPTQRLLAVAQQPCSQGEAAAVRSGFQRLQRALQLEEQRQLAAQVADVPTPPLPPVAQRLVARERVALEAAAGAAVCSPGVRGVVSAPSGQGHVAASEPAAATGEAEDQPAAKRARSASPDPLLAAGEAAAAGAVGAGAGAQQGQQAQRQRSDLERRIAGECEEAAAALGGALVMRTAPDSQEAGCVAVACMPAAAQQQARDSGIKASWQLLTLRVPPGYPEQPPTAVFPRASSGIAGAGAGQAAALQLQLQLADAAADAFAARVAALPPPHWLLPLAQAWLEATREVAARLAARQAALE